MERTNDYISPSGYKSIRWKCKCDCGNITTSTTGDLRRGHKKSCGCLLNETPFFSPFKSNCKYDLTGTYGVGRINQSQEEVVFFFDLADYQLIKDYHWYLNSKGYLRGAKRSMKKQVFMHRLITKCPKGLTVDHIDHNKLNNQRSNLRICTLSQNQTNKVPKTSYGVRGVSRYGNRYNAVIYKNKQRHNLGWFDNLEDAITARKEAEEKYFGEYSYNNSIGTKEKDEEN